MNSTQSQRAAGTVDLSGRAAMITGGASGIGLACAERLAQAGAIVTVVDLDGNAAKHVADQIGGHALELDLSDGAALDTLDVTADILINNAGFQIVMPLHEFPVEGFIKMQRLMVEAPFRLSRACLPKMYENSYGRIVNISSVHGRVASPFKVGYVTAKHGLEGMSKVIALEGGDKGVTCNCICPGYVRTRLVERQIAAQAAAHGIAPSEVIEKVMLADTAVKRLIEPAEVAEFVVYLCSSDASYINGASLAMDGGWTAR